MSSYVFRGPEWRAVSLSVLVMLLLVIVSQSAARSETGSEYHFEIERTANIIDRYFPGRRGGTVTFSIKGVGKAGEFQGEASYNVDLLVSNTRTSKYVRRAKGTRAVKGSFKRLDDWQHGVVFEFDLDLTWPYASSTPVIVITDEHDVEKRRDPVSADFTLPSTAGWFRIGIIRGSYRADTTSVPEFQVQPDVQDGAAVVTSVDLVKVIGPAPALTAKAERPLVLADPRFPNGIIVSVPETVPLIKAGLAQARARLAGDGQGRLYGGSQAETGGREIEFRDARAGGQLAMRYAWTGEPASQPVHETMTAEMVTAGDGIATGEARFEVGTNFEIKEFRRLVDTGDIETDREYPMRVLVVDTFHPNRSAFDVARELGVQPVLIIDPKNYTHLDTGYTSFWKVLLNYSLLLGRIAEHELSAYSPFNASKISGGGMPWPLTEANLLQSTTDKPYPTLTFRARGSYDFEVDIAFLADPGVYRPFKELATPKTYSFKSVKLDANADLIHAGLIPCVQIAGVGVIAAIETGGAAAIGVIWGIGQCTWRLFRTHIVQERLAHSVIYNTYAVYLSNMLNGLRGRSAQRDGTVRGPNMAERTIFEHAKALFDSGNRGHILALSREGLKTANAASLSLGMLKPGPTGVDMARLDEHADATKRVQEGQKWVVIPADTGEALELDVGGNKISSLAARNYLAVMAAGKPIRICSYPQGDPSETWAARVRIDGDGNIAVVQGDRLVCY